MEQLTLGHVASALKKKNEIEGDTLCELVQKLNHPTYSEQAKLRYNKTG